MLPAGPAPRHCCIRDHAAIRCPPPLRGYWADPSRLRAPICITPDTLSGVLTRLRRGTAPGLTGWTYEHILDATCRPSARRACVAFLNDMLAVRLPHVPELLDSVSIPLH
jgi:hypothetical protein